MVHLSPLWLCRLPEQEVHQKVPLAWMVHLRQVHPLKGGNLLHDLLAVNDVETLAEFRNIVAEIASVDRVNALNSRLVVHLNVLYASSTGIGYEYLVEEVAQLALEGELHLAVTLDSGREVAP